MFPTKETVLFFSATGKRSAVKLSPFLEWTGHCCPTTWKEKQKLCDISLMLDFWHIGRVFLWNIWNICPGLPTLASSLGVGVWNKNQGFRFSRNFNSYFRKFAQIKTVCKYALYTEYSKNIGTTIEAIGAFSMCSYRKVLNVNVGRSSVFGVYVVE